jgi:hypothetical protein
MTDREQEKFNLDKRKEQNKPTTQGTRQTERTGRKIHNNTERMLKNPNAAK